MNKMNVKYPGGYSMGNNIENKFKSEKKYLERIKKHPKQVILASSDAKQGGIELFFSEMMKKRHCLKKCAR